MKYHFEGLRNDCGYPITNDLELLQTLHTQKYFILYAVLHEGCH